MGIICSVWFVFYGGTRIDCFFDNLCIYERKTNRTYRCNRVFSFMQWRVYTGKKETKEDRTSASSNMVNSPGLPRLKGPTCSPSIKATNPSTCKFKKIEFIASFQWIFQELFSLFNTISVHSRTCNLHAVFKFQVLAQLKVLSSTNLNLTNITSRAMQGKDLLVFINQDKKSYLRGIFILPWT